MLELTIEGKEGWNEKTEEFVKVPTVMLRLEHSLLSVSKWEQKWHKPFLVPNPDRTPDENRDYVRCMSLAPFSDDVLYRLTPDHHRQINDYINDPATATTTKTKRSRASNQFISSELIYARMVEFQIPFSAEKWHLNRLLKLIEVLANNQKPAKKMPKREIYSQNAAINAARKAQYNTRG